VTLLQQTLAANDADVEEEGVGVQNAAGGSAGVRRKGNMASMSGGDESVYLEKKRGRQETHPLFKRFRMAK